MKAGRIPRYVVDLKAVDDLQKVVNPDVQIQEEPLSNDGYMPILRVPSLFRRLSGYSVYHRARKSAF